MRKLARCAFVGTAQA